MRLDATVVTPDALHAAGAASTGEVLAPARRHARRMAKPGAKPRLVMTDYVFLLALLIALLLAVDPLESDLKSMSVVRHLMLPPFLACVALTAIGVRVFQRETRWPQTGATLLPMTLLALTIVAGSVVARFYYGVENSFLGAGTSMLVAPASAWLLVRCGDPRAFLRTLAWMMAPFALVVFVQLAVNYNVRQIHHELEFLFPPLAVLIAFAVPRGTRRWAGIAFFLLLALLHKKNTGYFAELIVLAYLVLLEAWPRWSEGDRLKKITRVQWTLIAAAALSGLIVFFILNREQYLPSGNTEFRLFTYERAWQRFLESPLWGNAFTGAASEKFTVFDTGVSNNVLPTHSDILDIFANGGLIGCVLWLWSLLRVARVAWRDALHPRHRHHPLAPYAHWLAATALVVIVTYAFNPMIQQPDKSFLMWSGLGFLAGIAALMRADAQQTGGKDRR